jgi:hypothetical protein
VNDLSNNIDLPSILTRAERLFLRYQRTVEAIDRKTHFPAPSTSASLRARKPQAELPHPPSEHADDDDNGKNKPGRSVPYTQHAKPGGLVGAIAAIGAAQRPTSGGAGHQQQSSHGSPGQQARKGAGVGAGSGSDARAQEEAEAEAEAKRQQQRIITPELRDLLSRKVPKLDKSTVKAHGGGVN